MKQTLLTVVFFCGALAVTDLGRTRADIYQWEYVDATDPGLGRQPSTTLVPGGEGLEPGPGMDANWQDLTKAWLSGTDLTGSSLYQANLTDADLSGAILRDVELDATLTDADFSGADVRGARFFTYHSERGERGLTQSQLYSTASYQSGDLTGFRLTGGAMRDWDFAGKNLTLARFSYNQMTDVDLEGANLEESDFSGSILRSVDLSGADLRSATFQESVLNSVNLSGSNVAVIDFFDADLFGVDTRAVSNLESFNFDLSFAANLENHIKPDGHVMPLWVSGERTLRLWDFDPTLISHDSGEPVGDIPIVVQGQMVIGSNAKLRVVFEDNQWGSVIAFEPGIPVELSGTLELLLDDHVEAAGLVGTTYRLFDWAGVTPSGQFNQINFHDGTEWDTNDLYTTGEVTLLSAGTVLTCDLNADGAVDAADAAMIFGAWGIAPNGGHPADKNSDGVIDAADAVGLFEQWTGDTSQVGDFALVPEPGSGLVMTLVGLLAMYRTSFETIK